MENINNITNANEKDVTKRLEWLVDRLMRAEEERDSALDRLEEAQLDNLALRARLHAISLILDGETFLTEDEENDINAAVEQVYGTSEELF